MRHLLYCAVAALAASSSLVLADTVTFKNGDKLTGKIGLISGSDLKLNTPALGDVTVKLSEVAAYRIDTPVVVQPKDGPALLGQVSGDGANVKVNDATYALGQLKSVNAPPDKWTGKVLVNFALSRGNTNNFVIGGQADAMKRRDTDTHDDRLTFHAEYNFGQSGGGSGGVPNTTDTDNWQTFGKYDQFYSEKFYGYATVKVEHDRIADLDYRLTPGVGLGYQWIETPATKFSTEAGLSYVREVYGHDGDNDYLSLRLAYHVDHQFSAMVDAFHNLEYLPAVDDPGDYNLNADAGLSFKIVGNWTSQLKVEFKRDSTPAEGALKNDLQFLLGVGYSF